MINQEFFIIQKNNFPINENESKIMKNSKLNAIIQIKL